MKVTRRRFASSAAGSAALLSMGAAQADEGKNIHRLAIQVSESNPAVMTLALNNAVNVARHFTGMGQEIEIELVAYGPGLHMLRDDTSPVKDRVKSVRESLADVTFTACGNTIENIEKAEGKKIVLLPRSKVVAAGVVRLMELQEQGWSYIRP